MNHPFDTAVALQALGEGAFQGATSAAYANMVGPYGGITAATLVQAILQHPDRLGEPLSLTVNFAAAVADGGFEVRADPVRTNRSTQHWVVTLQQQGEVVVTATAITAARRTTWSVDDAPLPQVLSAAALSRRPEAPVPWIGRYDIRFAKGSLPRHWDGAESPAGTTLWVRDEPPRPLDFASLTAMSDVFFPRVWLRRATRVPAGTVSMTIYFHAGSADLAAVGEGWLLAECGASAFRNGFSDQHAHLWDAEGRLLVTTHQVVYYKE
ncbi:MAG: acyl-CoA thioesterase [Comamonadaceae bacterium]|jgi:acyl-CoA thioesterase|nr:acyl-CoA thioesterase [Comamonadaceae bacterium]